MRILTLFRRQGCRVLLPVFAIGFVVFGSINSFNTSSFHDYLGGRLPRSDSSGWVVGSVTAVRGIKQDWVVRRPLNVAFNAPIFQFSVEQIGDPLLTTLLIKRLMAVAAIVLLFLSLHGVLSIALNLLLFILLGAVLFGPPLGSLSGVFGMAVGYTHGTELNGFIVVNFAVASLVAASRLCGLLASGSVFLAFTYFLPGLTLLSYGLLLRPGSLAMMPLIVASIFISISNIFPAKGSHLRRSPFWGWLLALAILVASLVPGFAIQSFVYRSITTDCGVIGGNQGYTLYGMSLGSNWSLGIRDAQKLRLGSCERDINNFLLRRGKAQFIANPLPLVGLVASNFAVCLGKCFVVCLPVWILFACTLLKTRSRRSFLRAWANNWQLRTVFSLGAAGFISIELFLFFFYQEAGLRPVSAYAAFPLIVLVSLIQFCVSAIRVPYNAPLLHPLATEPSDDHARQELQLPDLLRSLQRLVVVVPLILLTLLIGWGAFLVAWPNQSFAAAGSRLLSGEVRVPNEAEQSDINYKEFLRQIQENYRIRSADPGCVSNRGFVVKYTRTRLPGGFPLGDITLECKPKA